MFVYGHINRHLRVSHEQAPDGYIYIVLSGGYVSSVDSEDYDRFSQFTYHRSVYGYAIRHLPTRKRMSLHREIMNAPNDMCVDHINGDRLDNRKCNLRLCTTMQNTWNRGLHSKNTSGYTGIYWIEKSQVWRVTITVAGEVKRLGHYKDKDEAIRVRREAELFYYGEFAPTPERR